VDDLWARLEVAEGAMFCHPSTLIARPTRLNRFCSDRALTGFEPALRLVDHIDAVRTLTSQSHAR
jgi:hypothetical protein